MAHFARVNRNSGKVDRVIVVGNSDCGGGDFPESEPIGQEFIKNVLRDDGTWLQTSYNHNFRNRYAGIGYVYDFNRDVFLPPKPFNSWTLNENVLEWEPPVPYPNDGKLYDWDERTLSWIEVILPEPPPEE